MVSSTPELKAELIRDFSLAMVGGSRLIRIMFRDGVAFVVLVTL